MKEPLRVGQLLGGRDHGKAKAEVREGHGEARAETRGRPGR